MSNSPLYPSDIGLETPLHGFKELPYAVTLVLIHQFTHDDKHPQTGEDNQSKRPLEV